MRPWRAPPPCVIHARAWGPVLQPGPQHGLEDVEEGVGGDARRRQLEAGRRPQRLRPTRKRKVSFFLTLGRGKKALQSRLKNKPEYEIQGNRILK